MTKISFGVTAQILTFMILKTKLVSAHAYISQGNGIQVPNMVLLMLILLFLLYYL